MFKFVYDSVDPFLEVKKKRDKRKEVWVFFFALLLVLIHVFTALIMAW